MDVNISSQVAKMRRDLLKLIGVGEFSDAAAWKDPCTSFVIPEVLLVLNRNVFCEINAQLLYYFCKIIIVTQMQQKFRAKSKKLYFGFVDFERAFDRVPREVIRWAMRKLGVEEWLVSAVMSMYPCPKTVVRTVYGNSNGFKVKVGMHQGSALSPLLCVIVMEALSREFRVALPWELLYADDLVVVAETEEDLIKSLNEWKDFVENRGMRVNMNKTKVGNGRR